MRIAIIARKRYCARLIELLNSCPNLDYQHTDSKLFGTEELAVFDVGGPEEDIIFTEKLIKGEFVSMDVLSYRYITGKFPWIENPQK